MQSTARRNTRQYLYTFGITIAITIMEVMTLTVCADELTEGYSGNSDTGKDGIVYDHNTGTYTKDGEDCNFRAQETIVTGDDGEAGMGGGSSEGSTSTSTSTKTNNKKDTTSIDEFAYGSITGNETTYADGSTRREYTNTVTGSSGSTTFIPGKPGKQCEGDYCDGGWAEHWVRNLDDDCVGDNCGTTVTTSNTGDQGITSYKYGDTIYKIEEDNKTDGGESYHVEYSYEGCEYFKSASDCAAYDATNGTSYNSGSADGSGLHITLNDKDGNEIKFDFTDSGTKKYKQTITKEDGTTEEVTTTVRATRSIENKTYFLGYDWHIENLDDRSSDLFGGGKSFTTPMPKATKGGRDKGGLYSVGKGVFKYTLNHFGNHTVTVTPWFDVDRYEVWYTESCNDPGGCTTTRHERYLDSRLESRDPKVYSVPVPLICDGCDGFKFCVGDGCADDCLNTIDLLCDEENAPEYITEDRVQLMR